MVDSLVKALAAGLSLWQHKDARKYLEKTFKLKKEWYEEYNKPESDDATLDDIMFQLQLISETFSSKVGVTDVTPE